MSIMESDSPLEKKKKRRKKKLQLEMAAMMAAYLVLRDRIEAIYSSLQAVESQVRLDNSFSLDGLLALVSTNLAAALGELEELQNSVLPEATAMAEKLKDKIAAAAITLSHEQHKVDEQHIAASVAAEEAADLFLSDAISPDEELTADETFDITNKLKDVDSYLAANLPEAQVADARLAAPAKIHKFSGPRLTMHSRSGFVDAGNSHAKDEVKLYLQSYGNTGIMLGVLAKPIGPLSFAFLPKVGLVPMGQGTFDLHDAKMVSSVISFLRPTLAATLRPDEQATRPLRTPFHLRPGTLPT